MYGQLATAFVLFLAIVFAQWATVAHAADNADATGLPTQATDYASIYEVPVVPMKRDTSSSPTLAPYRGDVLLIVNTASKCGYTPQYAGLQKLHEDYADKGLRVLGFPSDNFENEEFETEAEIVEFCEVNYGVTFPLYAKVDIVEHPPAPLFAYLLAQPRENAASIKWNFEKFLVGRDGRLIAHYDGDTTPENLVEAIEIALAEPAPEPEAE